MTRHELNSTAASLLGFLHAGPMSGWDLLSTARTVIGDFWSLTPSQVYRELATLERAGLIRAGARGPRERRPYTLTRAGRAAFVAWLDREPDAEQIRYPLLLTISFARLLPPDRLATFVANHRAEHERRLAGYQAARTAALQAGRPADPFAMATLDFGIRYETAVLEWFDHLPDEIQGNRAARATARQAARRAGYR